jgi:hypothetical protein
MKFDIKIKSVKSLVLFGFSMVILLNLFAFFAIKNYHYAMQPNTHTCESIEYDVKFMKYKVETNCNDSIENTIITSAVKVNNYNK